METNKDGGTSVGFTKSELVQFTKKGMDATMKVMKDIMNKECEHEWVDHPIEGRYCKNCNRRVDFKIAENLEQINKQQWEDIQAEFEKTEFFIKSDGFLFKWMKENYLAPEKKT